jgi:hypothetical protein
LQWFVEIPGCKLTNVYSVESLSFFFTASFKEKMNQGKSSSSLLGTWLREGVSDKSDVIDLKCWRAKLSVKFVGQKPAVFDTFFFLPEVLGAFKSKRSFGIDKSD